MEFGLSITDCLDCLLVFLELFGAFSGGFRKLFCTIFGELSKSFPRAFSKTPQPNSKYFLENKLQRPYREIHQIVVQKTVNNTSTHLIKLISYLQLQGKSKASQLKKR
jgi:hypothetical protein